MFLFRKNNRGRQLYLTIDKGYKVITQYQPLSNDFNYRIDVVIQGEKNRVAMAINEYWWGFANDISDRLREKKEITPKHRDSMNKCWKTAFRQGFKIP